MRTRPLGNTGLSASVLGFGCSAIMGRTGRSESLRALSTAWAAGITFYDTARSYGYGESEALLGEFLRTRRDRAIISTKFGILARRQPLWKQAAKPLVRALLGAMPSARSAVRKHVSGEFMQDQFTVAVLEQSLNESLRKLKTDYVDLLFLHDAPENALQQEELFFALEKLVTAGKVRVAGISAEPGVIIAALRQKPRPLMAAQFPCSLFDLSARWAGEAIVSCGWAGVANHPFGGVGGAEKCRPLLTEFAATAPTELREKLSNLSGPALSDVILNLVLGTPGIHVVTPAMMNPKHIRANVDAVLRSRLTAAELDLIREAFSPRLSPA